MDSIISFIKSVPEATLVFGILVFIIVCFANWNKSFRKKVNYYLSGKQQDEKQAYATAQGRLYRLNTVLIMIAGLVIVFSLAVLGIG